MQLCDFTLPTPEENLACDEALLAQCEAGNQEDLLRFWHSTRYFVALGYANRVSVEANLPFCEQNRIPVLRRCTGGGTVLQGPGCLNYALVLRFDQNPALQSIHGTNEFILECHRHALADLVGASVEMQGHTDLAIGGLKFSGNAQRRSRHFLLFHGSLLLNMDLELVEKALRMPSKQPEYRLNRSHRDFLLNLKVPEEVVKASLQRAWGTRDSLTTLPLERIEQLRAEKYASDHWNFKFP